MERSGQDQKGDRRDQGIYPWRVGLLALVVPFSIVLGSSVSLAVPLAQSSQVSDGLTDEALDPGFGADLYLGDRGDAVAQMQASLLYFGYDTGAIDGVFDELVQAQVLRFQGTHALPATGVMDAETQRVLLSPTLADYQRRLQVLAYYRGPIDGQSNPNYEAAKATFIAVNGVEVGEGGSLEAEFERVLFNPEAIAYRP